MSKTLDQAVLEEILPSSIRDDERMSASAAAVQPWLVSAATVGPDGNMWVNLDQLASDQLDHLAWQFMASVWRDTWPLNIKRATLRSIVEEKRKKGTRWAVERAVEHLGSSVEIVEWWEVTPNADPHTFEVIIYPGEIPGQATVDTQRDLYAAIDAAKPVRSHYKITLVQRMSGTLGIFGTFRAATVTRLKAVMS